MLSKGVDGIIISPVNIKSENITLIREEDLKTVYIDFAPDFDNINYVHVNHEHASYNATEYLIKKGHKDILLLNGPFQLSVSKDFLKGYLQALMNYGIRVKRSLIKYTELSLEGGYETIKKLYSSKNSENPNIFSAVLSLSDMLAIGVYGASKEIGFKIPDDLSIVGYDNISMSPYLSPPLTTIHAPKIRIGKLSIKILLDQIENKDKEFHKIILDTRLIERDSVKDINVK